MTPCIVGVDVGGTFTDAVLAVPGAALRTHKVPTTPEDPRRAVADAVAALLADAGVDPGAVTRLVHGTTLATNVILERRGGPVAFVTTAGFGDMLRLGREARVEDDRYDLSFTVPTPPVEHRMTFEAPERVAADGRVARALDPADAASLAAAVAASEPTAVGICFLHAYANDTNERIMAAALRDAMPATFVVTSSEVWPEMREYERATTTVLCAYVGPVMASYLDGLVERLAGIGVTCPVQVMDSSGAVMTASAAARRPVHTVESGGAAGVTSAGFLGRLLGEADVLSFDMGGTTAKVGVVHDGVPEITHQFQAGGHGSHGGARPGTGLPVKGPVVDLAEVGAGGGSIAWVDPGGGLRVGPRSAGAVPGPACYGRGGTDPTVTDANLVLGLLRDGALSGGVTLSTAAAEDALARGVAEPLGIDVPAAARAVHEIVNASMGAAIRLVTVQRGIDPRTFTLVSFGGAGPMHAAALAAIFDIRTVAVPWAAGVAGAIGLVVADAAVERAATRLLPAEEASMPVLAQLLDGLEADCRAELGLAADTPATVRRAVDVRYRGQAHQLPTPLDGTTDAASIVHRFTEVYEQAYGVRRVAPAELVTFRVRVAPIIERWSPAAMPSEVADATASGSRRVRWPGGDVETPVHSWTDLRAGAVIAGPALVDGPDTTVVVPEGVIATVDPWRTLLLRR